MKTTWLVLLGLIPTILVFIFASPWLGLVIGVITFLLLLLVYWFWCINVQSMISYFAEVLNIDEKDLVMKLIDKDGTYFNKHIRKTIERSLRGKKGW